MTRRFGQLQVLVSLGVAIGVSGGVAGCQGGDTSVSIDPPVTATNKAPPAISGGTLLIAEHTKNTAVASDPDRDVIWIVDLDKNVPTSIALEEDDEPGRLAEDSRGLVHVALRQGGAIVTVDLAKQKIVDRTPVCAAPRGIAYDSAKDAIHVACMNGELVTLPAAGGKATRKLQLQRDLRDVIVLSNGSLAVTKFRSAEVFSVDAEGNVGQAVSPAVITSSHIREQGVKEQFTPDVAWRTIKNPVSGDLVMLHQRALDSTVVVRQTGSSYGGGSSGGQGCDPTIVHGAVSNISVADVLDPSAATPSNAGSPAIPGALLPVDIAAHVDSEGKVSYAIASAANSFVITVAAHEVEDLVTNPGCTPGSNDTNNTTKTNGEPIALAYWGDNVVVQTRDPGAITVVGKGPATIYLPGNGESDTGHDHFHTNRGGSVALVCASCHPEGRDDGHVWNFNTGPRRTQNVAGNVLDTAPFHWDGKMKNMGMIMVEVFEKRMGGAKVGPQGVDAIQTWLSKVPRMANPIIGDAASIASGKALFEGKAACNQCHSGAKFTNNESKHVGTEDDNSGDPAFQVPSLVGVVMRAPYMHDGCAATLKERFTNPDCGGGSLHGKTADLTDGEIDDLVAYLETL